MKADAFTLERTPGSRVETLAVMLGDQLDVTAEPWRSLDPATDAVLLAEVLEESTVVWSHRQRTALFLSAMRHAAMALDARGIPVRYVRLDDPHNTQSLAGEIARAVTLLRPRRVVGMEAGEWRLVDLLRDAVARASSGVTVEVVPDPHFLTSIGDFRAWASGRKALVMEHFYRQQRRRLDVLMEDGKPAGGRWNYDAENRDAFRAAPAPPAPYTPVPDGVTEEVRRLVARRLPDAPGRLDAFTWPVTREEARRARDDFVEHRLPRFGSVQDAMWTDEPWLYHSRLGAPLNLKLLDVESCVDGAVRALGEGHAPLASVEGFVRQLIGWREFIRGVYWTEGDDYRTRNALGADGDLPGFYWTAETDMACMAHCLGQVVEHGYGHHIQRLMITGNFALIAGIHPTQVADWYLAMYVDAVDWVTAPNTVGMILHADGGVVGTKPYAASGRYVKRMSNYCRECRYEPGRRIPGAPGDREPCPFTVFYWDFLLRHETRFRSNRRMTLMLKHLDRIDDDEARLIRKQADELRVRFGIASS